MGCICTKSLYRTSTSECRHHPRIVPTTERNSPQVTKAKEAVEGRKIRRQIHRSSLGSCLVVQYYTHSTHFWFEPDSCFWSAALHITGRKWAHCISQDVKGEKWRKTSPSPYNSLKRKKKKIKWGKKPRQTEWKQIQKINKSTIGAAAEKGNIAEKLQRGDLKLWLHQ